MKTIEYTDPQAFLSAVAGTRAATRARVARPDLPRAGADERTGLTTLMERGWHVQSPDAERYRLYDPDRGLDTGLCASLKAACDRAKEMQK